MTRPENAPGDPRPYVVAAVVALATLLCILSLIL